MLDDAHADAVGSGPTIATAAAPLGIPGERIYALKPLAEAPAVELFRAHAPHDERSYAELAEVVAALGRLPGAIVRAATS